MRGWSTVLQKGIWGSWLTAGSTWVKMCPESPESKPHPVCIKHSITSQSGEVTIPLYSSRVQPPLGYCMHFWAPQSKKDGKMLKCIQRWAPKLMKGLEGISCEGYWSGEPVKLDGHSRSLPNEIVYLKIKSLLNILLYQILQFFMWEFKSFFPFHIRNEESAKAHRYVMYQNIFLK